jgi:methylase of polypeptide subunit release factors
MQPTRTVLEIASGTGLWTQALAGWADTVTAIDAAPEALTIAGDRVRSKRVWVELADVVCGSRRRALT